MCLLRADNIIIKTGDLRNRLMPLNQENRECVNLPLSVLDLRFSPVIHFNSVTIFYQQDPFQENPRDHHLALLPNWFSLTLPLFGLLFPSHPWLKMLNKFFSIHPIQICFSSGPREIWKLGHLKLVVDNCMYPALLLCTVVWLTCQEHVMDLF